MNHASPRLLLLLALALAALAAVWWREALLSQTRALLESVRLAGWTGMLIFVAVYVLACLVMLPGTVLSVGAAVAFGFWRGLLAVWLGATLGAAAAFLLARFVARDQVAAWVKKRPGFHAIDQAVSKQGWKIVFLTRLSPVFPFNVLNFAFGVTQVSFRDYLTATALGILPGTAAFVYAGTFARATLEDRARTPLEWLLYTLGLAATLAVTLQITRLARQALAAESPHHLEQTH